MLFKNERGYAQAYVIMLLFFTMTITAIISKNLSNLSKNESDVRDTLTDTIADTYNVESATDIAIGDNIYSITPTSVLKEDVYPIIESIEFDKDFTVVTATMNTRYNYVNYCILNENTVLDYRLDPKTQFVGLNMGDIDTGNSSLTSVTVKNYDYPTMAELIPYSSACSRNRLSFDVVNGVYALKYPQTYITSNTISEKSEMTTFSIKIPDKFTDIVFFQSTLTNKAPTLLRNISSEILDDIATIPHIRMTYSEDTNTIRLSTNLTNIQSRSINGLIADSGVLINLAMHSSEAYNITSNGSYLNYPTQTKFKYQSTNMFSLSNYIVSPVSYNIEFKDCIPSKIELLRSGYYHVVKTSNTVNRINY